MKRALAHLVILAVAVLFLAASLPTRAVVGFDPTPFQPEINRLGAIVNNLNSIEDRIKRVLGIPPDPVEPSPNVKGAVNRLEAIDNQLFLLDALKSSIVDEVLDIPPDPYLSDILPVLYDVRDVSQGIADIINAYLSIPPDPVVPEGFIDALSNVQISAQNLSDDTQMYIDMIGTPGEIIPVPKIADEGPDTPCEGYVIGGGTMLNDDGSIGHTFSGFLSRIGEDIVGRFQIVDHTRQKAEVWRCDDFEYLNFRPETNSVAFNGTYTSNRGNTMDIRVRINGREQALKDFFTMRYPDYDGPFIYHNRPLSGGNFITCRPAQ